MTDSASIPDEPLDVLAADLFVDEKAVRQQTLVGRGILLLGVVASVARCARESPVYFPFRMNPDLRLVCSSSRIGSSRYL